MYIFMTLATQKGNRAIARHHRPTDYATDTANGFANSVSCIISEVHTKLATEGHIINNCCIHCTSQGRTQWGAAGLQPPQTPQNRNKNTHFVDITISNVICDLPFSRNQPLKSADDWYIRILKNKLIELK
jgi:hypothetical protein